MPLGDELKVALHAVQCCNYEPASSVQSGKQHLTNTLNKLTTQPLSPQWQIAESLIQFNFEAISKKVNWVVALFSASRGAHLLFIVDYYILL